MSGVLATRWVWLFLLLAGPFARAEQFVWEDGGPGLAKIRITNEVPVIYSAIRIERAYFQKDLTLVTTLASNTVVGTAPLPDQIAALPKNLGKPVAAINADFFMMTGSAKGEPRGLHIWNGELVSVPTGTAAFWMDANGNLHGEPVRSKLTITWPGSEKHLVGLNEELGTNAMVLFTPRMGELYAPTNSNSRTVTRTNATVTRTNVSTRNTSARTNMGTRVITNSATRSSARTNNDTLNTIPKGGAIRPPGGREWILEHAGDGPWLPLRVGHQYAAKVVSYLNGFTNVPNGKIILMLGAGSMERASGLTNGAMVTIDVATEPDLKGQQHALGTGPMLVRGGKVYEVTARMSEQKHPRAAIGWNEKYLFLGVSDGRRKAVSEGIKLSEMAEFMIELGCDEVINMDGGQSSTLILNNEILNAQTPGSKHEVANGVVVLRRPTADDEEDVEK